MVSPAPSHLSSTLHEQLLVVSSLDMIVKSKGSMCPNSIYFGLKVLPT